MVREVSDEVREGDGEVREVSDYGEGESMEVSTVQVPNQIRRVSSQPQ